MPKKLHEWRKDAAQLNAAAKENGEPEPVPDYAKMRTKPLARRVTEAKIHGFYSSDNSEESRGGGR